MSARHRQLSGELICPDATGGYPEIGAPNSSAWFGHLQSLDPEWQRRSQSHYGMSTCTCPYTSYDITA
jgi:hypothetical protein